MIAALYVETGGCYFGIPGCYFDVNRSNSCDAAQRPGSRSPLSSRISGKAPRKGQGSFREMEICASWPERGERKALARGEPGEGCRQAKGVAGSQPRKGQTEAERVARAHRVQREAQRARREYQATTSSVWPDGRGLRAIAPLSRRSVRDLCVTRARHEECGSPVCRSLPQHQQGSGTSLPRLQYHAWLRSGQSGIVEGGSVLP